MIMHALVASRFGGPEVLDWRAVPRPEPGRGQVRIRVQAAALNPVDLATRAGALADAGLMSTTAPSGLGWDVCGTVDAVGEAVPDRNVGERVIAIRHLLFAPTGTHAEHVVLDAEAVTAAPSGVTAAQAATLPLAGLTAMQALERLALPAGASVLVTGAAGAVGAFTVRLAVLGGLRVLAQSGARSAAGLRELGAEAVLPRHEPPAAAARRAVRGGVDGVVDAALLGMPALDAVRDGGALVALSAGAAPLPLRGTTVHDVWIRTDARQLATLVRHVEAGRLQLPVGATFSLPDAAQAHTLLESGRARGKIVLLSP